MNIEVYIDKKKVHKLESATKIYILKTDSLKVFVHFHITMSMISFPASCIFYQKYS